MCSGRHVRQDKLFFNKNVSNVGPNNRQFWRFALKQFSHDLKKFKKELKDNYFFFFEHINQTNKKKETKLIVGFILVSSVSLTYSYFRFLLSKIDLYCLSVVINLKYISNNRVSRAEVSMKIDKQLRITNKHDLTFGAHCCRASQA